MANKNPVKIKTGSIISDDLIPRNGIMNPEKTINPIADPAKSALYTEEVVEISPFGIVSSL